MLLIDANVLINATRTDAVDHPLYFAWLSGLYQSKSPFVLTDLTIAALIRIITNPRIYANPHSIEEAMDVCKDMLGRPGCRTLSPSVRHWVIFEQLCRQSKVVGNLVNDAWLAALAIGHDCELISADRDFARFHGLKYRHPFD